MPVLEPNPTDGHKKLGQLAAIIGGIVVLLVIVAIVARNIG
ncbi:MULTISPECIES: SGM_5486 family transporter-associated protein [Streptomycetaceae]|nr:MULTISPECIES: SGM_5486 family transporter-associated protein [Streptomycetaceae]MCX4688488.1 SGM_5486 family transporter-associated protein [Kitasatospora purpeofusca]MCX4757287.1 SGM_5486 family transporter-associated protein [Kitasatospora purpeofusca]MDY0814193.1 SGM_5486 family transporter-associated protein [Kitasatospora purpeofusca]WSR34968.1 SGM_5486 family transporter-associated protein [Kitasatospora purpeofusca]WSR43187.1 SGM_5486 family transporter-associated protein [Kitasatosp